MASRKADYDRSMHLIDIENQIGSPCCTPGEIRRWFRLYTATVPLKHGDLVIIGVTNIHNRFAVEASGVTARVVHQFGPDGADLALQAVMRDEALEQRFGTIYCASGDGGFTEQVSRLGGGAAEVIVVARPLALARRLQLAAARVVLMPDRAEPKAVA
jgi:hypothetical protein